VKKHYLIFNIITVSLFALFTLLNLFVSNGEFSELENRALQSRPQLTMQNIVDRSYMNDMDSFSNDQLVFRNAFIKIKAKLERMLGRKENNGVYFAKDNYLIEKPAEFNKELIDKNISSVKALADTGKFDVSFCVIPQAFEILKDKLPQNTYSDVIVKLNEYVEKSLKDTSARSINVYDILNENKDEYIFYRLDHHQTSNGSFLVYEKLGDALGFTPLEKSDFVCEDVSEEFKGTTYSKGLTASAQDVISVFKTDINTSATVEFDENGEKSDSLFFEEHLESKDKYSYFLDGNHGITVIKGKAEGGKIALFKDSYAHSIAPLLINHFESIHLIDMRYYMDDPIKYLKENKIEKVLFLYGSSTFMTDETIAKTAEFAKNSPYLKSGLVAECENVGDAYFADAAFLGDSLTMGLQAYSGLPEATFLCRTSMSIGGVFGEESDGTSLVDKVKAAKPGKIYVMLGVNEEISMSNKENVMEKYQTLIDALMEQNPEAKIYIQSIMPYSKKKEADGKVKNEVIYNFNESLLKMAEENDIYYVDVYKAVTDNDGCMKENLTTDGIHLNAEGCKMWMEYLKCHAVGGGEEKSVKENVKSDVKDFSGKDFDLASIAKKIGETVKNEGDIGETSANMLISTHGVNEEYISGAYGVVGGGAYAEEIALFEVSDEKYADEVIESLKEYIKVRIKSFESYIPKEVPKLEKAVLCKSGKLVALVIAKDVGSAEDIIRDSKGM